MTHQEDQFKQIDQNNRSTRYGYDDLGRLETVTPEVTINDVAVPDTSYTYDEVGNKLTQTDAEGRVTSWTYDYYGRVLTRTLPELMVESFVYDDAARTVAHTDFNGKTNTTYIDNQGRVDHIDYHDGNSEAYTYWANGQIHTVTDQHGVTETVFDDRDRLDYEIKPDGTRLDYAYDLVGNREQVKVTRGTIITVTDYTYDALNRLDTVTDASGITSYTYYDNGSLWTVTFPNGVVSEYFYNDVNQLEVLTTKDKDGVVLSSYTYGLDDTGRREDITGADGRFTDYTYDNLYRLTDEVVTEGGLEVYNANYIYDWVGNRKYETVTDGSTVQTEYDYDLNDRLKSQGGTVYVHDDNGNTLTETIDSNVTTYVYDAKNKMTSVDKGGVVTGYSYDSNGIRTSKTEAGVTTQFVVDLNRDYAQVLEEVVGDIETAPATVQYSYGHDLLNQGRAGEFRFYSYDGLGSTRALTDDAGVVTDTYDYEAFGELLNSTGSSENSYLFTGEQLDGETGNYYLRARYLDPSVGRFTQQDTWMGNRNDPISLHKYLYAANDPALYVDPTGNFFSLSGLSTAMNIQGRLATASVSSYARIQGQVLWGKARDAIGDEISDQAFGMIGEFVVQQMINAVTGIPNTGQSAQSFGSSAHGKLDELIKDNVGELNKYLDRFNARLEAEVFRLDDGSRTDNNGRNRSKGSMGIDVTVVNTTTDKVIFGFDLKTGKAGTSKGKVPGYRKSHSNAPFIDVFVSRK